MKSSTRARRVKVRKSVLPDVGNEYFFVEVVARCFSSGSWSGSAILVRRDVPQPIEEGLVYCTDMSSHEELVRELRDRIDGLLEDVWRRPHDWVVGARTRRLLVQLEELQSFAFKASSKVVSMAGEQASPESLREKLLITELALRDRTLALVSEVHRLPDDELARLLCSDDEESRRCRAGSTQAIDTAELRLLIFKYVICPTEAALEANTRQREFLRSF